MKKQKRIKKALFHKKFPRHVWIPLAVEAIGQQLFHDKQQNSQSKKESTRVFLTRRMCDNRQLKWGVARDYSRQVNEATTQEAMRSALSGAVLHHSLWTVDGVDGTFIKGKDEVEAEKAITKYGDTWWRTRNGPKKHQEGALYVVEDAEHLHEGRPQFQMKTNRDASPNEVLVDRLDCLIEIKPEEEDILEEFGFNFSVIRLQTSETVFILSGPLRAINASCSRCNVRFAMDAKKTLKLVVLEKRPIEAYDRILADYGAEFFNGDWLCCCDEHWLPEATALSLERDHKRQGGQGAASSRPTRGASSYCVNADVCKRRRELKRKREDEHRNELYHP